MKTWKINLINYILYEIIVSNLSVMTWRSLYHFLDSYFYPNDSNLSAGISLLIGYSLYFPLMYFQNYLEDLHMKYEFWTFISINFPQFYRNIRHLFAFVSCILTWRGYWMYFDTYINIFDDYYKTCLFSSLGSFFILSLFQTASSINGPLSNINEKNNFFPLYPHCYVSIVYRKFSRYFSRRHTDQIN